MPAKRDASGRFVKGSGSGGKGGGGALFRVRTEADWKRVKRAAKKGAINSVTRAAQAIRITAKRSIRRSKRASSPGKPPNTQTKQLPASIRYEVDQDNESAVIGPVESVIGPAGEAHEFGGEFRGDEYPARPFMGPALDKITPRLPEFYRGSIRDR